MRRLLRSLALYLRDRWRARRRRKPHLQVAPLIDPGCECPACTGYERRAAR
jgi:hypothetical protein